MTAQCPSGAARQVVPDWLINAAAIVIGLLYRNGRPRYDKTLQTVLSERPCRVIVVSQKGTDQGADLTPALT